MKLLRSFDDAFMTLGKNVMKSVVFLGLSQMWFLIGWLAVSNVFDYHNCTIPFFTNYSIFFTAMLMLVTVFCAIQREQGADDILSEPWLSLMKARYLFLALWIMDLASLTLLLLFTRENQGYWRLGELISSPTFWAYFLLNYDSTTRGRLKGLLRIGIARLRSAATARARVGNSA